MTKPTAATDTLTRGMAAELAEADAVLSYWQVRSARAGLRPATDLRLELEASLR